MPPKKKKPGPGIEIGPQRDIGFEMGGGFGGGGGYGGIAPGTTMLGRAAAAYQKVWGVNQPAMRSGGGTRSIGKRGRSNQKPGKSKEKKPGKYKEKKPSTSLGPKPEPPKKIEFGKSVEKLDLKHGRDLAKKYQEKFGTGKQQYEEGQKRIAREEYWRSQAPEGRFRRETKVQPSSRSSRPTLLDRTAILESQRKAAESMARREAIGTAVTIAGSVILTPLLGGLIYTMLKNDRPGMRSTRLSSQSSEASRSRQSSKRVATNTAIARVHSGLKVGDIRNTGLAAGRKISSATSIRPLAFEDLSKRSLNEYIIGAFGKRK